MKAEVVHLLEQNRYDAKSGTLTFTEAERLSFWKLNIGLALMVLLNLFPGGIVQLRDVLENGYWHACSLDFIGQPLMRTLEWLRLPGDMVFILAGVVPAVLAAATAWRFRNESPSATANK